MTFKCEICNKEFESKEALDMHNSAKHIVHEKKKTDYKKIKRWFIFIVIIGVVIFLGYLLFLRNSESNISSPNLNLKEDDVKIIPAGAIHWHPRLTIKIDEQKIDIPNGIGINIGKRVDTYLSGMSMSPTHTHETDGTIHLENNNPSTKPETLTLGYFFYVWDKQFNSTCIFEYCNDNGTLKMMVNTKENLEFENYIMKDGDKIAIEYKSK